MRTIIISLLLASVAASPALAGPLSGGDPDQPRGHRADRAGAGRDNADRSDRSASEPRRFERREQPAFEPREQLRFEAREQPSPRPMTNDPGWARRGPDDNPIHAGRDARPSFDRNDPPESVEQVQQRFERRQQAIRGTGAAPRFGRSVDGELAPGDIRRDRIGTRAPLAVSDVPRPGTQPALRPDGRRTAPVQWNGSWRRDHRYDWRDHRNHHRSLFHVGVYFDPFGWGYRPYQVGWRMWPNYYSSRYWINDPWQYRLPYAPPGYRWIRYWDDALLVDTWTGEVMDSIPNFFW